MIEAYYQRNLSHQNNKHNPKLVSNRINLAEIADLRSTDLYSDKDLDKKDFFKTGVRGAPHYLPELRHLDCWGERFFELVPEPDNAFDTNAVIVSFNGHKIGYLSASIAEYFQGFVTGLQRAGKRIYVPGQVSKPHDGIIVLPTFRKMNQISQFESPQPIDKFWEFLPQELRQMVVANNFHFDSKSATALLSYKSSYPLYAPDDQGSPEESIPIVWGRFLRDLRIAHRATAAQQRIVRNKEMVQLAADGMSYKAIGEIYGLKASTVGQIVRDLRRTNPGSPMQERDTGKQNQTPEAIHSKKRRTFASIQERNAAIMQMKEDGLSHREIGEHVGLKRDTVKKIVQKMRTSPS